MTGRLSRALAALWASVVGARVDGPGLPAAPASRPAGPFARAILFDRQRSYVATFQVVDGLVLAAAPDCRHITRVDVDEWQRFYRVSLSAGAAVNVADIGRWVLERPGSDVLAYWPPDESWRAAHPHLEGREPVVAVDVDEL